jgi:hypothetical protein
MGWDIGALAVRLPVSELKDRFLGLWSKYQLVAKIDNLPNIDALGQWRDANEVFVSAVDWTKENPGSEVKGFYADGEWSVLMDFSSIICADEEELAQFSKAVGLVIVLTIGMHGGVASLDAYDNGRLVRRITSIDGRLRTEGEPLPNEQGIDLDSFYLDGADALWRSFGLQSILDHEPPGPMAAICVSDRTDFGAKHSHKLPEDCGPAADVSLSQTPKGVSAPGSPKKRWWRFW